MGKYSDRAGRRRHGPHGAKPAQEGVGFEVRIRNLPGQENEDDPIVWYGIFDRHDGEAVFSGLQPRSEVRAFCKGQIEMAAKVGGLTAEVVETETTPKGEN